MANPDMIVNADRLLPVLELEELMEVFDYPNIRSVRRAIRMDKFPVPTFQLGGRTVAHVDVIDVFFKAKRKESFKWMIDRYDEQDAAQTD